jgi:hypothetical protein
MDYLDKLQSDLNAIAAEPDGVVSTPVDWRATEIGKWNGMVAEHVFHHQDQWWQRPREDAAKGINELLKRVGYGELRGGDSKDKENHWAKEKESAMSVEEVSAVQSAKQKSAVEDEGEEWRSYLPNPGDDIRKWLARLPINLEIRGEATRWFDALQSYIAKFPTATRAADVDGQAIEKFVRIICENAHATEKG